MNHELIANLDINHFSHTSFDIDVDSCPFCGQEIPSDRIEEIRGKIAARDREHKRVLTAQMEHEHAIERANVEARAKEELAAERQRSAEREAHVRAEAQKDAEVLATERLAVVQRSHRDAEAVLNQRIVQAEATGRSAEGQRLALQGELQASIAALEAVKTEAKSREAAVAAQAKKDAEAAAAERIALAERKNQESESHLQLRLKEADTEKLAAQQKQTELATQLEEVRRSNLVEIAKVKADATNDVMRITEEATAAAEIRSQELIAAHVHTATEAAQRAQAAESKLALLDEQHDAKLKEELNLQREALEQASQAAVNAEKAKAFEETQKLSNKVSDLQRALEKRTAEELGEGAEVDLYEALKAEFPDDKIMRIPKGSAGADIRHVVLLNGNECGKILYDSKNHNAFRYDHVSKLRADQIADKAEHAILSTRKFPQGRGQVHVQDGVVLANPARVVSLASIIRQHLMHVYTLRSSGIEREKKTVALYEFITSEHCASLLERIDGQAEGLLTLQATEMKWHQNNWERQGVALRNIQKAKGDLVQRISLIIGTAGLDSQTP